MKALLNRLLAFLTVLLQQAAVNCVIYKEDTLYLLESDRKIIRLQDFMSGGITTKFSLEEIDPIKKEPDGALPPGFEIFDSMRSLYNFTEANTETDPQKPKNKIFLDDVLDIDSGMQQYFLARTQKNFMLLINSEEKSDQTSLLLPTLIKTISFDDFTSLYSYVFERHIFMFFSSAYNGMTTLRMFYVYLDSDNTNHFTSRATVNIAGKSDEFKPEHYRVHVNFTTASQIEILGYHTSNFNYLNSQFFYISITLGDKINAEGKLLRLAMNATDNVESLYYMISAGIYEVKTDVERLRMVLKRKKSNLGNQYMMTTCLMQISDSLVSCSTPTKIKETRLLNNTLSRGLDLGGGQFGILTEQFLLYHTDNTMTKFAKIYLRVNRSYVDFDDQVTTEYGIKNEKYIGIALGEKDVIKGYFIIEYGSKDPEVFENNSCDSKYFRLQGGTLFTSRKYTLDGITRIKHVGEGFSDAYVSINGSFVNNKTIKSSESKNEERLKFKIVAKVNNNTVAEKNFTAILIKNPMNSIELKVPFDAVKVIRGGTISLLLKEEYFTANDAILTIKSPKNKLEIDVASNYQLELVFTDFSGTGLYEPTSKEVGYKVYYIKLLWDNLLLMASMKDDVTTVSVCFISNFDSASYTPTCKLYSYMTISNLKVTDAKLLNFDHFVLITNDTSYKDSANSKYFATIYKFQSDSSNKTKAISPSVEFYSLARMKSFINYAYSSSAVITYINKGPGENEYSLKRLVLRQGLDNIYAKEDYDIKYDKSLITELKVLIPDYTSKAYFYIGVVELHVKKITYQAIVKKVGNHYNFVKVREISSEIVSSSAYDYFCAGQQELVSVGKVASKVLPNVAVKDEIIFSTPFQVPYNVYQKMVRKFPLESLNLTYVVQYHCMGDKNSLVVVATNQTDSSKATDQDLVQVINYDLDFVNEPRNRIETIQTMKNKNTKDLLFTASAHSYNFMDFIVLSQIEPDNSRKFYYLNQPIKQIPFEIKTPFSISNSVPITMELKVGHSPSNATASQELNIKVRPLDYSTLINVNDDNRLSKKPGNYSLEGDEKDKALTIEGHFFGTRLWNVIAKAEMKDDGTQKTPIALKKRLVTKEEVNVSNALKVRLVGDLILLREVTGNIEILYNKKDRSKKLVIQSQCSAFDTDYVSNEKNTGLFYMFLLEDIIGGVVVRYFEANIELLKKSDSLEKAIVYSYNQTYEGVFKAPIELYCQNNFYLLMVSKITNELVLSSISRNDRSRLNGTDKDTTNVTIKLNETPLATELVCLNDSHDGKDSSVAMIVVYPNQTQALYKYRREVNIESVKMIHLDVTAVKQIYFTDVECDLESAVAIKGSSDFESTIKCFYSTRWADDYLVTHSLRLGPTTLDLKSTKIIQQVKEVKNFEVVKTIAEDKYVLVMGYNLEEEQGTRKLYCLIYDFSMNNKTYVRGYFSLENPLFIDYERFRDLIHVSNEGSIVYLKKTTNLSNSFNTVVIVELTELGLEIRNIQFNPEEINLEILDISGVPLEKISLINLFQLTKEVTEMQENNFMAFMILIFLGSLLVLFASLCFYFVMNKLYLRKVQHMKKITSMNRIKTSLKQLQTTVSADIDFEEENSQEFINDLVRDFKVEMLVR